jgi:HD-GYP domain-containing protein (c-di-GMP phosphodiesterase class II)
MTSVDTGATGMSNGTWASMPEVDDITGLGGPDALLSAVDLAIEVGAPEQRTVALLLLDVELGGRSGDPRADDQAYRSIAGALAAACRREADSLFRVGPQRFAAVLPAASAEASRSVARRAVTSIDAVGVEVRVWAGVAEWPFDGATSEELLDAAHPTAEVVAQLRDEAAVDDGRRCRAEELSVTTLVSGVVRRAPWLDGHADRVSRLCSEVGQMLSLDERAIESLGMAALLHDVGMIGLSDHVLGARRPLDASGWAAVKQTPEAGARIVAGFTSVSDTAPAVRTHREHWDGSGYPQGLAGEAIPLAGRILAACEAYDAMVSERPYRAQLTAPAARSQLEQESGTHFDPAVVAALDRVLDRHRAGVPVAVNGGGQVPRSRLAQS